MNSMFQHPFFRDNYLEQSKSELRGFRIIICEIIHNQKDAEQESETYRKSYREWPTFNILNLKTDLDAKLSSSNPLNFEDDLDELLELSNQCLFEYSRLLNYQKNQKSLVKKSEIVTETHNTEIHLPLYKHQIEFSNEVKLLCLKKKTYLQTLRRSRKNETNGDSQKSQEFEDDKIEAKYILSRILKKASTHEQNLLIDLLVNHKYDKHYQEILPTGIQINVESQRDLLGVLSRLVEKLGFEKSSWNYFAKLFACCWYYKNGKKKDFNENTIRKNRC